MRSLTRVYAVLTLLVLLASYQRRGAGLALGTARTLAVLLAISGSLAFFGCSQPAAQEEIVAASSTSAPATSTAQPTPTSTPTLLPSPTSTPTPQPRATLLPSPTATFPPLLPTVTQVGSLTIEQYPVVANGVDTPDHFEYMQRLGHALLQKRAAWRSPLPSAQVNRANVALGRFGYRLVLKQKAGDDTTYYDLLYGEEPVQSDLTFFWPPSLSSTGSDFALIVEDSDSTYLVRNGSTIRWEASQHAYAFPVFAGEDLISVNVDQSAAPEEKLSVLRGDQSVFSLTLPGPFVSNPVKKLAAWGGRWVLEVDGQVWVESQSLGQQPGYTEIFGWQLLAGKPFYFYRSSAAGPIRVSYDGRDLPLTYDEVIHYRCCEPAVFNAAGNDSMVWFHASRGGTWYYVELGDYTAAVADTEPQSEQPSVGIVPASGGPEPTLSEGTLKQAEKAVGLAARLPTHLPAWAVRDSVVHYYAENGRGLLSLSYRVGSHGLSIEFRTPPLKNFEPASDRVAPVGGYPALILTQPPPSSDAATPTSVVTWRDGQATVEVRGDLTVDELIAIAQSMY